MQRREFVRILGSAPLWPIVAQAQHQSKRIPRVAYLESKTRTPVVEGLLTGLRELGYVHGQNIRMVEQQYAGPTVREMKEAILAVLSDSDILVVTGTIGGIAAKSATSDVPVVFIAVGAPVDIGLVKTLANPGRNMTGTTFEAALETYAKRLQILKEIMPTLSRVAVLAAVDDPNFPFAMSSLKEAASNLSVSITPIAISSAVDLERAFGEMKQTRVEALLVVSGVLTYLSNKEIADLTLANRFPSCHGFKEAVAAGGLVSLGPDLVSLGRQAARLVGKIVRGQRPADIPVEQPAQYVMTINLKTAKSLGLDVPPSMLARAEEVIE
jgi:putative ABC transport system substrate-binding protein